MKLYKIIHVIQNYKINVRKKVFEFEVYITDKKQSVRNRSMLKWKIIF